MGKKNSDISTYHFHGTNAGPKVLITAGVHGDEYEPMLAAWKIINLLPDELVAGSVSVVPVVNRSAFLNGNRTGSDGLDLARICPGHYNGSDSEVAAAQVSELISHSDIYIDLHTGGRMFDIMPLAGYMLHPSEEVLSRQRMMAESFGLPVIWGTDYQPDGRTLSVARDCNVPAIYVEYGGGEGIKEKAIDIICKGCLNVLRKLEMVKSNKEVNSVWKYWLEDHTVDSGYLQAKMASPGRGIFVPEVSIGGTIKKGQKWGEIIDPLNGNSVTAEADKEGIVLMTRAGAFVNEGESLGCILPATKPGKSVIHE